MITRKVVPASIPIRWTTNGDVGAQREVSSRWLNPEPTQALRSWLEVGSQLKKSAQFTPRTVALDLEISRFKNSGARVF